MQTMSDFYYLSWDGSEDFHVPLYKKGKISSFPDLAEKIPEISRGKYKPDFVPSFTLTKFARKRPISIISPGLGFILRNDVLELWQQKRVTGYTTFPVNLLGMFNRVVENGHMLGITSRCGPLSFNQTEPDLTEYNPNVVEYRGVSFDPASWDGSDIFCTTTHDNTMALVTQRLKDICTNAKVEGIEFVPLNRVKSHSHLRDELKHLYFD